MPIRREPEKKKQDALQEGEDAPEVPGAPGFSCLKSKAKERERPVGD